MHETCIFFLLLGLKDEVGNFCAKWSRWRAFGFVLTSFIWMSCLKIRLNGSVEPRRSEHSTRKSKRRYVCVCTCMWYWFMCLHYVLRVDNDCLSWTAAHYKPSQSCRPARPGGEQPTVTGWGGERTSNSVKP